MYRLLIVDDEKIEREGMAQFISWGKYDIELVGTAWNGQDGYEKALKSRPDIVLTDIKMPVMDGIELIRKLKSDFPDMVFIVLSGYGEYECTSRAMEQGVKYYILKPCDEERILPVFEKVKEEIEQKRATKRRYDAAMKNLFPLAREQIFRNLLLNQEISQKEYQIFMEEVGNSPDNVRLLAFRNPSRRFDALEQFIIENVLTELAGEKEICLETSISEDVLFLLYGRDMLRIEKGVERICKEFVRINPQKIQSAISDTGDIKSISMLYTQIQELFRIGTLMHQTGLLCSEMFSRYEGNTFELFRYRQLRQARNYAEVLFEIYLAFMKMELQGINTMQKKEICSLVYPMFCEENGKVPDFEWESVDTNDWILLGVMTELLSKWKGIDMSSRKEEIRMKEILLAAYENLQNTELSIRYLAKEVLFMNKEHLGRIFMRYQNMKFSDWLRKVRIDLAKCIFAYTPEIKISKLATLVGYSSDGQYFSKAFRKETGMAPTEYSEWKQREQE